MTDLISGALLVLGAAFALVAAIGVVRLPDVLSRMHPATKPQSFGLLLILAGVALRMPSWKDLLILAIIVLFQLLTAPVSAHMIGRAAFRTGSVDRSRLTVCETPDDSLPPAETDPPRS